MDRLLVVGSCGNWLLRKPSIPWARIIILVNSAEHIPQAWPTWGPPRIPTDGTPPLPQD